MVYTFNLAQKNILITGGYGHLGKAIVESLLFHGANVFVLGQSLDKFQEAFGNKEHIKLHFVHCNIQETTSIKTAFENIFTAHKQIDVLINNAFYSSGQSPLNMTDEDWVNGIDGTLNSTFRCIREIIPYFLEAGSGKIINVSSMYGVVAPDFSIYNDSPEFLNPPHYGAAKAGVIQLTKYYASYLGHKNIKVNAVTPGPFPSNKVQENEKFIEQLKSKTCLNKIGKPEDLAGAFVFLSSDAANFITGQNIIVDGGWTIK